MRSKEEYLGLLKETVDFYSEDTSRRATNDVGDCLYKTSDGRNCAVGRCLVHPEAASEGQAVTSDLLGDLKEEYKGYDIEFWEKLQHLHDHSRYWSDGLTDKGEKYVQGLKNNIHDGYFN